jgi:hypothetical protein
MKKPEHRKRSFAHHIEQTQTTRRFNLTETIVMLRQRWILEMRTSRIERSDIRYRLRFSEGVTCRTSACFAVASQSPYEETGEAADWGVAP